MKRLLVTGGAGFIGSNFVRHILRTRDDCAITVLDALTYAGHLENLEDIKDDSRFEFVKGDIRNAEDVAGPVEKAE
jgi:dTDP-glucose 4,6-dehydratase